ncbi:MAG: hypothetical protein GY796_19740 [Chloroflexi bacterium]|nr:hypothetical protein [Chloroflexota bacterium]
MNKNSLRWLIILIILFAAASLACNALPGGNEPAVEEAVVAEPAAQSEDGAVEEPVESAPAAESSNEESAESAPVAESSNEESAESAPVAENSSEGTAVDQIKSLFVNEITQPEDVNSYRIIMDMSMTSTDEADVETSQSFQINLGFSKDPEAMSMNMSAEGVEDMEEFGEMNMAQLDGVTYMTIPGFGCITSSEDESAFGDDDPFADFTDTSAFMEDIGEANYEGEESINGIDTLHYTFDETSLETPDADVEWLEGHIYVAKDGGWLVRMVMEGEGEFDEIGGVPQYGNMKLQIDLLDINQPIDVSIPADCEGEAAGETAWPMVADAANVSSFGGIVTYETEMPLEDVLAFYDNAFSAEGWTKNEDSSFEMGDTAIITYEMDGASLNLSVSKEDPNNDTLTVVVVGE